MQLGLMLTDKQEGPFRLEIEWIDVETEGQLPEIPPDD